MNIYKLKRVITGMSRKIAAEKLEISWYHLRNIENGQRTPGNKVLIKMSELYKCSIDELLKAS